MTYDFFVNAFIGFSALSNVSVQVIEDFSRPRNAKYPTLETPKKMSTNYKTDQLFVVLKQNLIYIFEVYDPTYFFGFYQPSVPMVRKTCDPNDTENNYNFLTMTQVVELDLPEDPCNGDPTYDFQACVRKGLSSQVGCR